jgi:hypothetical protein
LNPVSLFATRDEANSENSQRLKCLTGETHIYRAVDDGDSSLIKDCLFPETLELKIGAQVVLLKNIDEQFVNGSTGIVVGFETSMLNTVAYPIVKFDNGISWTICIDLWKHETSRGVLLASHTQVPLLLA